MSLSLNVYNGMVAFVQKIDIWCWNRVSEQIVYKYDNYNTFTPIFPQFFIKLFLIVHAAGKVYISTANMYR